MTGAGAFTTRLPIKDRRNNVMGKLDNVLLLEDLVDFLCKYELDRTAHTLRMKIESFRGYITLMTKYADIPEVWVRKVHVMLRDNILVIAITTVTFVDSDLFSDDFKSDASRRRIELNDLSNTFEDVREDWLFVHPQELEFMFDKMGCWIQCS